ILLDLIAESGLTGKTLLDLGCGTGFFALETLRKGMSSCVGLDLSTIAIQEANAYAKESGYGDRAKFEVADGATAQPPSSDIVVMDKVLCCYPDSTSLLKTATESARQLFGFVIPRDEGWMKPFMRCGAAIMNLVDKLRRSGFRFYLHPIHMIDEQLIEAGFRRTAKAESRVWLIFLYTRNANARL
ncbi:MAG TPA: class I SAM-dependent methyltransferase, partial [Candidatus Bathyarchaeia archaeon]|nr:class I SAM-dependent methyltransferase [Candidatus Bathyarchaeia archaeon]